MTMLDRQPPWDSEAEHAALGSMLLDPQQIDEVALIIRPDEFFDETNRTICETIFEINESGKPLDIRLLVDRLKSTGKFDKVGGAAKLAKVSGSVPNAAHSRYYAKIVHDKAMQRWLINAGTETIRDGYDAPSNGLSVSETIERCESRIFEVTERNIGASVDVQDVREILLEAMETIERRRAGDITAGIPTGYRDLDEMLGGLRRKEMVVVGGRPGHGKSAMGMGLALNAAAGGANVLFVSLEMSRQEISERMLASMSQIHLSRLRNGTFRPEQQQRLVEAASRVSTLPIWIDDSPARNMTQIGAMARRHKRRQGLDILVIDYLQLVTPEKTRNANRQEQVAAMSRRCKTLARECDATLMVLAQVNRESEGHNRAPRLSELRESGAIEQDADVVMFIHDPESEERQGIAEIHVAKHRNGPTGMVELVFRRDYTRLEDRAPDRFDDEQAGWNDRQVDTGGGEGDNDQSQLDF